MVDVYVIGKNWSINHAKYALIESWVSHFLLMSTKNWFYDTKNKPKKICFTTSFFDNLTVMNLIVQHSFEYLEAHNEAMSHINYE